MTDPAHPEDEQPIVCWLDLETNTLDWEEPEAQILELAMILTDRQLNILRGRVWLVLPDRFGSHSRRGGAVDALRARSEPAVREMHDISGLWRDLSDVEAAFDRLIAEGGQMVYPNTLTLADQAEAWLSSEITTRGGMYDLPVPLAGSGVDRFDRRWLERFMPGFGARFTYWAYDRAR